ncbi:hypothetical protein [Dickeya dianthicola]|uniref:hypothetical protein n=1 Tax=Dickeya dianthicola TaxID=204039 RepID=UPI00040CEE88|nr:hypothetical protein [Dickeya dianthicola]
MNLKPLFLGVLLATTYATANAATTTVEKSATDATATSTAPVSAESALGKAVDKANTDAAINAERDVSAVKANVGGENVAKTEKVAAETPMQGEEKLAKKNGEKTPCCQYQYKEKDQCQHRGKNGRYEKQ